MEADLVQPTEAYDTNLHTSFPLLNLFRHGVGANHELPLNAVHGLTDSLDQIEPDDYYRLLDCGFQLPLTNGSDHPARVAGCARAYVKIDGEFTYEKWIDGIRRGRTFTTSGPLMTLTVNNRDIGDVLTTTANEPLQIQVTAKSRFPLGRVQILSNGAILKEIETQEISSDGVEQTVTFEHTLEKSSWAAIRIFPSAHTNPLFVIVDEKPIRASRLSAQWCLKSVEQCWKAKAHTYRADERATADADYETAKDVFRRIVEESP